MKKYELICRKINIKSSDIILDLGCGFGGFAKYATEKYGSFVVGVNISEQQISYANELCASLPVEFHLCDYRDIDKYTERYKKFDKIVSIGLCEHIGHKNYRTFFDIVNSLLKREGLFLLHTIGNKTTKLYADPWIDKYIFPNGMTPSLKLLSAALEGRFIVEDLHNFGADYDKTAMAWLENFKHNWKELQQDYDARFFRMWNYYLSAGAGAFRARDQQLWQLVLSPFGVAGGYVRPWE